MATSARGRSRILSLPQQALGLRSVFPDSEITLRGRRLRWIAGLRPAELSPPYRTRIDYEIGQYPTVHVIDPPITDVYDRVPHIYNTGALCVHDADDFTPAMLLVDTVVAWTIEWLYYWELFLATDLWYGDGPGNDPAAAGTSADTDQPPRHAPAASVACAAAELTPPHYGVVNPVRGRNQEHRRMEAMPAPLFGVR